MFALKIVQSNINMSSQNIKLSSKNQTESLRVWADGKELQAKLSDKSKLISLKLDKLELSQAAKNSIPKAVTPINDENLIELELSDEDKQKIELIENLLKQLTGKDYKFYNVDKLKFRKTDTPEVHAPSQNNSSAPQRLGWGIQYDFHEVKLEAEHTTFNAEGVVKTADGRTISFKVDTSMYRESRSETTIRFRAGDAPIDPLFINFSGTPSYSNTRSQFDLNSDGVMENIPDVASNGGYLALDKNNDGVINNGTELFGPQSGDGFSELAQYDTDNNNWIDENDPIFNSLQIWMKDTNGNDKLYALAEKGLGAIYLGNVETDFTIKNNTDSVLAQIKKSGIYLNENGSVGTIQHIDLSV